MAEYGEREALMNTIDELPAIPETASFRELRSMYHTGRGFAPFPGAKPRDYKMRSGIMTEVGDVEETVWRTAMLRCIDRANERALFEALKIYVMNTCAWIDDFAAAEMYALELHSSRIFEDPDWVCYADFRASLLSEGLLPPTPAVDGPVSVSLDAFIGGT